nr:hypothetical protein [Ramlibacter albus]
MQMEGFAAVQREAGTNIPEVEMPNYVVKRPLFELRRHLEIFGPKWLEQIVDPLRLPK